MSGDSRLSPLDVARQVIADEASALQRVAETLGANFDAAVRAILEPRRQVIVSGLGKSGVIAQKIAASLTSTGTPAVYMHPVEALHGDLGIVTQQHVLIALSRSGNTEEVVRFVAHFRRLGGPVIGLTQGAGSKLAELSQIPLILPDLPEAGPLALAPTTSCIMQLAVGDSLAMALLHARGFRADDFAQYHPEGSLGRRLLLRASDVMHAGDALPLAPANDSFKHLLQVMTEKKLGLALIVEPGGGLVGVFTDGDLRRILSRVDNPLTLDARSAWSQSRRPGNAPAVRRSTVAPDDLAVECLNLMRESQITSLIVVDPANRPVGVLRLMDLIAAGLG
jgi:arabinose-5-phosphate isomerase